MSVSFNYTDTFEDSSTTVTQGDGPTPVESTRLDVGVTSLMHHAETEEIITVFQDATEAIPTVFSQTEMVPSIVTDASLDTSARTLLGSDSRREVTWEESEDTASLYSYSESYDVTRQRSSDATDRDVLSSSDLSSPKPSPRLASSQLPERVSQRKNSGAVRSFGQSLKQSQLSRAPSYYDDTFEDYTDDITASVIRFFPDQELVKFFPDEMITSGEEEEEEEAVASRAQREFVSKRIHQLQAPEPSTPTLTDISDASVEEREEDPDVRRFCRRMVQAVHAAQRKTSPEKKRPSPKGRQLVEDSVAGYGLNPAVVERLRLQNLQMRFSRAANAKIHDVRTCKKCRRLAESLETSARQRHFCDFHGQRLQALSMDARVEQHIANTTSLALIGELAASLPRPTQKPEDLMFLWQSRALRIRQEHLDAKQELSQLSKPTS